MSLVTLEGKAVLEPDKVSIGFNLRNQGAAVIYAYLGTDDGSRTKILHGRAYSSLTPEENALHLLLGIPPCPPLLNVVRGVLPAAVPLTPGGAWDGSVEFDLPAHEWSPYARVHYPDDCPTVMVHEIQLSVQYTSGDSLLFREEGPEPGWYWTQGRGTESAEVSIRLPRPIEVLKRTDDFVRF